MNPIGTHSHEDKLLEFAYGELPVAEARMLEAHVKGCQRCAGALESIRGVRRTMAELTPEPAPEAGLDSLLAYAEQAARRTQAGPELRPAWWRRWVVPTASLAALVVIVVAVRQSTLDMPSPEKVMAESKRGAEASRAPAPADFPRMAQKDAAQAPPPAVAQMAQQAQVGERVVPQSRPSGALTVEVDKSVHRREQLYKDKKVALAPRQDGFNAGAVRAKADAPEAPAPAKAELAASEAQGDAEKEELAELTGKARDAQPAPAANAAPPPMASSGYQRSAPIAAKKAAVEDEAASGLSLRGSKAARSRSRVSDDDFDSALGGSVAGAGGASSIGAGPEAQKPGDARLDARALVAQADSAKREGNRGSEVQLLRQAVAVASGTELERVLTRLCDAEVELGVETLGCERLIREFPRSSGAQMALRRLSSAPATAAKQAPMSEPARAKAVRAAPKAKAKAAADAEPLLTQ